MSIWPFSRWPFNWRGRDGNRASTTDLLLLGQSGAADGVLGTVEACLSLWADAVASAVLESPYDVPSAERACLVREFLIRGEALRRLDIRDGRPVLAAARCANVVSASPDPAEWRYWLDVASPSGTIHATYPADRVFHWRRAPSPSMPWKGRSVLADAPALATLAHAVERSLLGEHAVPSSRVMDLKVPWRQKPYKKGEFEDSLPIAHLVGDGTVQVQSLDRGMEARGDVAQRIGAEPDESTIELRDQLRRDLQSAFGVPGGLLLAESGSAQSTRELRSLWLRGRVMPVLDALGAELSRVFGGPVSWSLPLLEAEHLDIESRRRQRRAMAIGALIGRGLSREDAVSLHDGGL